MRKLKDALVIASIPFLPFLLVVLFAFVFTFQVFSDLTDGRSRNFRG